MHPTRIFPLGENAVTVEFGDEISERLNNAATSLAAYFETHRFPGYVEAVPAIASATIFYDLHDVRRSFPQHMTAFEAVKKVVENAAEGLPEAPSENNRTVEIPVSFGDENALDLQLIAEAAGLDKQKVIEVFLSSTYRVYMLGFLPGFPYMGIVDERIAVPRRSSPRLAVPKGSVGIAGRQTGIYPSESPGGWQIIGKTELELFTPDETSPCLFHPGDTVRFIDAAAQH
jgi:inhibitor of KinA